MGKLASALDIQFIANNLKFNQSTLQASGGELDITVVTNSLADTGGRLGQFFHLRRRIQSVGQTATGRFAGD
jgi:hypothetical protein